MTRTVSFRDRFKSGLALFNHELKSCSSTLIVFAILASTFIAIVLTLTLVAGYSEAVNDGGFDYSDVQNALTVFQYIAGYIIFILSAIFTIIYTIRIYSYLHNKRKADLYGSMPISRRTFYVSKTVTAFLLSVAPSLIFLGLISVITITLGQPLVLDTVMMFVKLPLGAIACISFYGLLAVCSGTSLNAVLSFIAINAAYPLSTLFIKGAIKAFFAGMPTNQYAGSFIMKALNPLAAYDGTNIVYWLIFTAACLFLGIWLVKKRRAECAQTSFAYHLPCYIVEVLVAFIIGMFIGVLFGSLNVMLYGYLGFIFGFVLGSAPAFIITHLILYKGFSKLWKSAIPCGAMMLTVIALMGVCNYDVFGYNRFLPAHDSIKSAGLVDLCNCYCARSKGALSIANMAADDYDDSKSVDVITQFHRSAIDAADAESYEKFASVWQNMFLSNIPSEYIDNSYCVAYRLNNGRLIYRYYDSTYSTGFFGESRTLEINTAKKITGSDKYFTEYSNIMNSDLSAVKSLEFSFHFKNNDVNFDSQSSIPIESSDSVDEKTAEKDRRLVTESYRSDVREKGKKTDGDYLGDLCVTYNPEETGESSFSGTLVKLIDGAFGVPEVVPVYSGHTNTLEALKEAGILNSDNTLNKNSEYYKKRTFPLYGGYNY